MMKRCDWPPCKMEAIWYNANGKACIDHSLWLSTIHGGNDVIAPIIKERNSD